jgi:hypothetical protein
MIGRRVKTAVNKISMVVVMATGLTGIYNLASAKVEEHKQAAVMKAATNCEWNLTYKGTPCSLAEQKAMVTREALEQREWSGAKKLGVAALITMAAF